LDEKVYLPLAFELPKNDSITEILKQLVLINDTHSQVYDKDISINFNDFEKDVMEKFAQIQGSSTERNADETS